MVNTNKILTVSYGTFSCTLEGFDDSFDTMKAIAEYFRDLAADDRYFGAEPPTPDADMLARIAEREVARRVEAREDDGKIVLRAEDAPALAGLAAAHAPQQQPAADAPTPEMPEAVGKSQDDKPAAQDAPDAVQPDAQGVTDTSEADAMVAEDISPVEAAQDSVEPQSNVQPDLGPQAEAASPITDEVAQDSRSIDARADTVDDTSEVQSTPETEGAAERVAEAQPEPEAEGEDQPEVAAAAEPEAVAEIQADATEDSQLEQEDVQPKAEQSAAVAEAKPEDESDSVAAKLRRIRSVVSHADQDYGDSDYTEDEHAEDEYAQDFVDATAADMDGALAQDDAAEIAEAAQDDADQVQDDDDLDALLARFDDDTQEDEALSMPEPAGAEPQPDATDLAEDTLAQLLADAMPEQDQSPDLPQDTDEASTPLRLGPESAVDQAEIADEGKTSEEIEIADHATENADEQPMLRARVVKMKRTEFEAALAKGYIEEDTEDDALNVFGEAADDDRATHEPEDSGLSAEEEAELQRELAEVEAELSMDAAPEEDAAPQDTADRADAQPDQTEVAVQAQAADDGAPVAEQDDNALRGRDKLEQGQKPQTDVNRIFDKADSHLEEPESHQRRSVIRHLRAAVAATRAEKNAGAELDKDVDDTPYRSDLQEVVRPRRPQATGAVRSARPEDQRPAPLKLVAEQRVDTETPREPVRPRRISSSALMSAQTTGLATDSGFAEFAEQMGATRLPDLLEAAAAYLSDVEGRPQFSRPMLMGKLKEVSQDNFSREDGLRSFGQLLRDGKLQKLKGGRFAVTEETDFRDEARNAG